MNISGSNYLSMELELIGPLKIYSVNEDNFFNSPSALKSGIYIYAVQVVDMGYLATYVGETGASYSKRIKEHTVNTMSGYERIYAPDALQAGKKDLLWDGLWKSNRQNCFGEFIERYDELAPIISQYIRLFDIFLLPIDSTARIRRRIESSIARHLMCQPTPISGFIDSDIRYLKNLKDDESPIDVKISGSSAICGFPYYVSA